MDTIDGTRKFTETGELAMSETLEARVKAQTITAMKARDGERTTTLRLITTALKNRLIEKRLDPNSSLPEAESQQVLASMIKQRRDSIDQFTKGGRPELAEKERLEIGMIEGYLPQAASEDEVRAVVQGAIHTLTADNNGVRPGPKDLGTTMRVVQQRIQASGLRADGRMVSELVRAELGK